VVHQIWQIKIKNLNYKLKYFFLSNRFYASQPTLNLQLDKDKDNYLGYYLAGLIEGDGYISITNKNRVILGITFNIKDRPLAEKLLSLIGKGTIVKRKVIV
jgi:hypothetical protein